MEAPPASGPISDLRDGAGDDELDVEGNVLEGGIVAVVDGEKVESAKISGPP